MGEAEDDGEATKHADHHEQDGADLALDWSHREQDSHQYCTDAWCRSQDAVADLTDTQNVARHDGEERSCATEQHRDQIETNRAEQGGCRDD
ncbi:MAG: hypothetical protein WCR59_04620 [Planctomycetota bacterium]